MNQDLVPFLKRFYRAVTFEPIEFTSQDSSRYVRIYDDPAFSEHDPVKLLARSIEFSLGRSVQLFSGFRGSGKSTELHRLRQHLTGLGSYKVVLCDIEDYLNPSQSIDVSDFLMVLAGAFGEKLKEAGHLDHDPSHEGYWTRAVNFLQRTDVNFPELSAGMSGGGASVGLKAFLKSDPSFRQKLQKLMAGHLAALVGDVRQYVAECVNQVRAKWGPDTEVVLLLDSMEHIRGTSTNAAQVQDSVVNLFVAHADKLQFDNLHVVYTIPPYLKVLYGNLGTHYDPGGVHVLRALKVHDREGNAYQPGIDLLEHVIAQRGDWQRLLGPNRATLDELSRLSGGHLRDFLRLFAEIIRRADTLPVPAHTIASAVDQVRSEFLPISDSDAEWLDLISIRHDTALRDHSKVHDLARLLDTHLALCYRNGMEWYDVHPLVREVVKKQATEVAEHAAQKK